MCLYGIGINEFVGYFLVIGNIYGVYVVGLFFVGGVEYGIRG